MLDSLAMPRLAHRLALVAIAVTALAGCGGGGSPTAAPSDARGLLRETFSPDRRVESGRLDLALRQGDRRLAVRGPFATEGEGSAPRFALDVDAEGLSAGVTSTGEEGFVEFAGQAYAIPGAMFRTLRANLEEGQRQGARSFATLGIDPTRWVTDPRTAGEAKVGEDAALRIRGGVDVPRMLEDLDRLAQRAGRLGGAAGGPPRLGAGERRELERAVRNARVEVFTGAEDRVLRRLVLAFDLRDEGATRLDLRLTDVNEEQTIEAPGDARPLDELLERFGGLGALGGLGGGSGGGGGRGDARALDRYADCIARAGRDSAAARDCARLLTP